MYIVFATRDGEVYYIGVAPTKETAAAMADDVELEDCEVAFVQEVKYIVKG